MRNSEKIYNIDEIKQNKEEYAKRFSEGDIILEAILKLAYDNNVYTHACCKGHSFTELVYAPYLTFIIEECNKEMYSMMLEYFENADNKQLLNVCLTKANGYVAVSIHHKYGNRFSFKKQKQFFTTIYEGLKYGLKNKDKVNEKFLDLINFYDYLCEDISYSGNYFECESLEDNPIFLIIDKDDSDNKYFNMSSKAKYLITNLDQMFPISPGEEIYYHNIDIENLDKYYSLSRDLKSKH